MTQPDIYTVEAHRRLAEAGYAFCAGGVIEALAATLRELNWQPPVDPDLLEAREIVAGINGVSPVYTVFAAEVLQGKRDDHTEIKVALAAIKRGRELERGE